ncbi:MAG TPA: M2 family metallopeptidase, partial [Myxococcales bacterium LLY-WYZ-16_1]|nr:M2 family metallopeptidase [Myxococcales bacterium LLY-WYZ-16_1]
ISPPMRSLYAEFVALANEGARDIGFADLGELWRSGYDMPPEDFAKEVDRLWEEVSPLYEALHCYVRAKLVETHGKDLVDPKGKIPAQLLGNMWAQEWGNIYPLVAPYPKASNLDVTGALEKKKVSAVDMVKMGEAFFTSLGLEPLPKTFYERSMFTKPADRDVVCHASAWDVTSNNDLRIKMCIRPTEEDLITIHHELGHNYYYLYYHELPVLYQSGAHDGFHEGIGDTLALSVTPEYLRDIGILDGVSRSQEALINLQMKEALDKIAFLPFGKLIDEWRWNVFSGDIPPEEYNSAWWELRESAQGIRAPVPRSEDDFDPGAKYHIPANTPYTRYFLARILQFQFHQALCEAADHDGPLYTCSIHGSEAAGERLMKMLAMGASQPWPEALEAIAGTREMDGTALVEYFEPLLAWLEEANEGRSCGWPTDG